MSRRRMVSLGVWICPLLLQVAACAAVAGVPKQRPISPEDIVDLRWISVRAFALSPDGRQVAYIMIEWDKSQPKAKRKSTLWLVATDGRKPARRVARKHQRVKNQQWSPDGKTLAFLSKPKGKDEKYQLFTMQADGTGVKQLTDVPQGVDDYQWAPDNRALAFSAFPLEKKQEEGAPIEVGKHPKRKRLWVVALANQTVTPILKGNQHVIEFTWAPDAKRFGVVVAPTSALDDVFTKARLVLVDRQTGSVTKTLSRNVAAGFKPAWSPDGQAIIFPRFSAKHIALRLAMIPAKGGKIRYPLDDYRGTPFGTVQWAHDSRHAWVQTFETTRNRLLHVDTKTDQYRYVAKDVRNFWNFSVSRDQRTLILNGETGKKPPELFVFQDGRRLRQLTDLNPHVAKWPVGNVREIRWENKRDGKVITGVLVTPHDFQRNKPYPTIVELHGGPQGMWWSGWLGTYVSRGQFFASRGYVVFLPNPRGSIGQGWRFVEANYQDWGGMDVQDILDGVDHLVAEHIADPKRLVVGGGSYGGFLTAMITTKTNRFRAAIVDAGITDLRTWNFTTDISCPLHAYMGGDEFRRQELYRKCSPFTYVQKCRTPTLILHGEKDERVPLMQGRAWFKALQVLGVKTEMVVYPKGGHLLSERAQQLDAMQRVLAWYQTHLK